MDLDDRSGHWALSSLLERQKQGIQSSHFYGKVYTISQAEVYINYLDLHQINDATRLSFLY